MPTHSHLRKIRSGFTLIEVLTVIAIIGILIGLLVPAVITVSNGIKASAMSFEVQTLSNAIEQYKNKYGDFPPDGSNAATLVSHLRKAFPHIAPSEIALLTTDFFPGTSVPLVNFTNGSPAGVMDPPEALVLFLGGLSDDETYPFSGIGGPIFITNSSGTQVTSSVPPSGRAAIQYNVDRNNPLFDFKQAQLSLDTSTGITVSNDELSLFTGGVNDVLPVYSPSGGRQAPYVYFDSRSYSFVGGSNGRAFNLYAPDNIAGVARPYKSDDIQTTVTPVVNADQHFRYQNPDSFQIIGAGLDDEYGGVLGLPYGGRAGQFMASPVFYAYPSGKSINISTATGENPSAPARLVQYSEAVGAPSPQMDNVTNFADGILENALP